SVSSTFVQSRLRKATLPEAPPPVRCCRKRGVPAMQEPGEHFMPSYKAPVEEVLFLLRDVFPIQRYNNLPGFAEATPDVVEAIVSGAAKLCEEPLQPLKQTGDRPA